MFNSYHSLNISQHSSVDIYTYDMSRWGDLLSKLLAERGITLSRFGEMVSASHSNISKLIRGVPAGNGKNPLLPPLKRLSEWADKLRLTEEERHAFFLLAFREHCADATDAHAAACAARVSDAGGCYDAPNSDERLTAMAQRIEDLEQRCQRYRAIIVAHIADEKRQVGILRALVDDM